MPMHTLPPPPLLIYSHSPLSFTQTQAHMLYLNGAEDKGSSVHLGLPC